jgi:hypothetical protein
MKYSIVKATTHNESFETKAGVLPFIRTYMMKIDICLNPYEYLFSVPLYWPHC